MRPNSILMFERLFLASLAGSLLGTVLTFDEVVNSVGADPALRNVGLGGGFVVGVMVVSFAVYLLLWYLIAHKASNVAKWILVVFIAIGVIMAVPSLAGPFGAMQYLGLAICALQVAAVVFLFRADAAAWFNGDRPAGAATFD